MPGNDDVLWRRRLLIYSLVRAAGLVVFFFGLAIFYTNIIREGGWPQLGAIIAIFGAIGALFMPRLLKRAWDRQDQERL